MSVCELLLTWQGQRPELRPVPLPGSVGDQSKAGRGLAWFSLAGNCFFGIGLENRKAAFYWGGRLSPGLQGSLCEFASIKKLLSPLLLLPLFPFLLFSSLFLLPPPLLPPLSPPPLLLPFLPPSLLTYLLPFFFSLFVF